MNFEFCSRMKEIDANQRRVFQMRRRGPEAFHWPTNFETAGFVKVIHATLALVEKINFGSVRHSSGLWENKQKTPAGIFTFVKYKYINISIF